MLTYLFSLSLLPSPGSVLSMPTGSPSAPGAVSTVSPTRSTTTPPQKNQNGHVHSMLRVPAGFITCLARYHIRCEHVRCDECDAEELVHSGEDWFVCEECGYTVCWWCFDDDDDSDCCSTTGNALTFGDPVSSHCQCKVCGENCKSGMFFLGCRWAKPVARTSFHQQNAHIMCEH